METLLERRMEQFQCRVQQNVNLADDEIARLSSYLATVKGDVADGRDQLSRLAIKTTQLLQEASGRGKRHHANFDTTASHLRAEHHAQMHDLQARQAQEVASLHQAFEDAVAEIDQRSAHTIQSKTAPVDEQIGKVQAEIKRLAATEASASQQPEDDAVEDVRELHDLEMKRQQRLESAVEARNQERLDALIQAKTRLSDCVSALEEMERNHTSGMESYRTRLETMDGRYQDRVKRETERHTRVADSLRRKQAELEKRANAVQRTIRRIERAHKKQVDDAMRKGEMLKMSIEATEARVQQTTHETGKVQAWNEKLQGLRKRLEASENGLMRTRTDNEAMKREVARLRHEAAIVKRRAMVAGKNV